MTNSRRPAATVVIPAHNEASVIERCLKSLFTYPQIETLEVIVACNGCTDDTAERARTWSKDVTVLQLPQPSKPAALRAADEVASGFPRIYLDADVVLPASAVSAMVTSLSSGAVDAARPPVHYDTSRSTWPVRAYYSAREQIPSVMGSLWGAGVYGLSAGGRGRFGTYPDVVADDLYVDQHFTAGETVILECLPVRVAAPRRSADLLQVLRRQCRGNTENMLLREMPGGEHENRIAESVRPSAPSTIKDLRRLAMRGPRRAAQALVYAGFATLARVLWRLDPAARWERDDSSRAA